jgi:hypothetical protein
MCCCQKTTDQTIQGGCMDAIPAKYAYKRNPVLDATKPPKQPIRNMEEQVWDIARTSEKGLSVRDVRRQVVGEITYYRVKAWLDKWQAAGYVARTADTSTYPTVYLYEVTHDCGQKPPQVDGHGAPKKQSGVDIIWRTARILKRFNARQIIASANDGDTTLNERAVSQYLLSLYDAGYMTWTNTADTQSLAQYLLTVNTGPKAPEIQRGKKVYDGNLGMIVYDPETPLPPAHQNEVERSKQKQAARAQAKQAKKGARHV